MSISKKVILFIFHHGGTSPTKSLGRYLNTLQQKTNLVFFCLVGQFEMLTLSEKLFYLSNNIQLLISRKIGEVGY